jgi:hypothetical protein
MEIQQDSHETGMSPPSLPHLIYWKRKMSSWHTNPKLEMHMKFWRSGKDLHPSRILFIGPSKRLND